MRAPVTTFTSLAAVLIGSASAFSPSTPTTFARSSTQLSAEVSRDGFLKQMAGTAAAGTFSTLIPSAAFAEDVVQLPSGTSYVVTKSGDGPQPKVGEMAAIRFKASVVQTGNKIDDIFDTPEPYYTRVGSGGLLKGVEEVLPKMRVGDRFLLTIPTNMAFGPKGRPASAGKQRIPSDAIISFDVEMVGLPGRETELIDLIGDD